MSAEVQGTKLRHAHPLLLEHSSHHGNRLRPMTRFEVVASHLLALLDTKNVDFAFAVYLFDNILTRFKGGNLVQNTPQIRGELAQFMAMNGPNGGTSLEVAITGLFEVSQAQEYFLLTDGEDNEEATLVKLASTSHVPLNCIGVDLSRNGKTLIEKIAEAGRGECSCVQSNEVTVEEE